MVVTRACSAAGKALRACRKTGSKKKTSNKGKSMKRKAGGSPSSRPAKRRRT